MQICSTTDLLPHQQAAVDKLLALRVGALFMDMGTGKSRTAIELAARRSERITRVIWFTLVSLKETVRHEILKHTNSGQGEIYLFDSHTTDANLPEASWYVIGLESLGGSSRIMLAANRAITEDSLVIVDESSYIKGHRAKRTNRVTAIAKRARYRLVLTGTPISQGVQDLYSQMAFLSPKILGYRSWYSFAKNHLEYSERHLGMIVATHHTEWLAAKIAPYVYQVTKDECLDLPPKMHKRFSCDLSSEQIDAYGAAKERFYREVLELDDGRQYQSSLPFLRLFSTLQAIVCGFVREENETWPLEHNRLRLLKTVLAGIPADEPVVIWTKYHFCREQIAAAINDRLICQYHGKISEKQRHQEVVKWRREGGVLLATQDAGGHGLDLTAARYAIFYANGFKYSSRIQAEDRFHRIGQTRTAIYSDIYADCGIEDRIAKAIANKEDAVATFRNEVNAVKDSRDDALRKLIEKL
ncbi:MAG: DEAD/DEAH box helicase [Desulfobulbus sp.]|jgi:SNF2 family DNA or RNA helicase|uniref:DEAD/DEAH box helicase n=1 Tax=Desulfobulbus sp. TaxID=895 RepID=UPI00284DF09D|nr:DEAD/DEAH box helicase [Desulfobulbus sp.]MDR2551427.1 DEAD/DEAH box helicase [Desulfobulbus sp.]